MVLPVSFSADASAELLRLRDSLKLPDNQGLRVGIRGGGCSGASLIIGFDSISDTDHCYTYEGMTVIINKSHSMYVAGMHVDFEEGLGFSFQNETDGVI